MLARLSSSRRSSPAEGSGRCRRRPAGRPAVTSLGTGPPPRSRPVGAVVRPERAAPARPADVGGSTTAPVCDPGTVPDAADPAPVTEAWIAPTWEQVVRDHSARVYRLAYRLSGNPQDAEDLTQETFVRVFRSLADFSPGTFEGWLHRITTNLFLRSEERRVGKECRS